MSGASCRMFNMAVYIYLHIFIIYAEKQVRVYSWRYNSEVPLSITERNGAKIEELFTDLNLSVLNDVSHTYTSRIYVRFTTSEISLSSSCMTKDCNWTTLPDSGSDHFSILISMGKKYPAGDETLKKLTGKIFLRN